MVTPFLLYRITNITSCIPTTCAHLGTLPSAPSGQLVRPRQRTAGPFRQHTIVAPVSPFWSPSFYNTHYKKKRHNWCLDKDAENLFLPGLVGILCSGIEMVQRGMALPGLAQNRGIGSFKFLCHMHDHARVRRF